MFKKNFYNKSTPYKKRGFTTSKKPKSWGKKKTWLPPKKQATSSWKKAKKVTYKKKY